MEDELSEGQMVSVRITGSMAYDLTGIVVTSAPSVTMPAGFVASDLGVQ